jgi:hypothetical protein
MWLTVKGFRPTPLTPSGTDTSANTPPPSLCRPAEGAESTVDHACPQHSTTLAAGRRYAPSLRGLLRRRGGRRDQNRTDLAAR